MRLTTVLFPMALASLAAACAGEDPGVSFEEDASEASPSGDTGAGGEGGEVDDAGTSPSSDAAPTSDASTATDASSANDGAATRDAAQPGHDAAQITSDAAQSGTDAAADAAASDSGSTPRFPCGSALASYAGTFEGSAIASSQAPSRVQGTLDFKLIPASTGDTWLLLSAGGFKGSDAQGNPFTSGGLTGELLDDGRKAIKGGSFGGLYRSVGFAGVLRGGCMSGDPKALNGTWSFVDNATAFSAEGTWAVTEKK